ncbi:hypothetical protein [Rummeliibacillus suwonensis]|uniref:hypothetical protein n=1 Tax=Rummeliibacillus suwonensis TaxID=1306154 RepID=UPI0011B66708|nr:hypothetical protein [Rummeliibacillus suwonensis]
MIKEKLWEEFGLSQRQFQRYVETIRERFPAFAMINGAEEFLEHDVKFLRIICSAVKNEKMSIESVVENIYTIKTLYSKDNKN